MSSSVENNKRIAKNTAMLYIRMLLIMAVTLYTSRVVLEVLGVEDFGIYNVVGTVVVAFSFISGPLGTATQRFLNYELGKNDIFRLNKVFSLSIIIYALLAVILFFVVEVIGLWFIASEMQYPIERLAAVRLVFHFSVFTFIVNLFRTCFESLIIAHEKMSFFAYLSIVDVILILLNAMSLVYFTVDKLELFAINQFVISLLILYCAIFYVKNKMIHVHILRIWDSRLFKELLGFSGWSLFGSVASMSANQGLNILLNTFYGVTINAAMGIANQVSSAVNQFVLNFQTAFRPQIVKSYASGDIDYLRNLIFRTGKFSFFLLFAIVCPLIFNMDFVLHLWLGDSVPQYASEFCSLMLIYSLLETLSAPLWMTVQATGKIRMYQIVISSFIFLNIVLSYLFLKAGFSPSIVLEIKCVLDISYLIVRILFVKRMIGISYREYFREVILPVVIVSSLSALCFLILCDLNFDPNWKYVFVSVICFEILFFLFVFIGGMKRVEREMVSTYIFSRLNRIKKRD